MPDLPSTPSTGTPESASPSYEGFLKDIKGRIRSAQARAARAINAELIDVYWQIGHEILRRQTAEGNLYVNAVNELIANDERCGDFTNTT